MSESVRSTTPNFDTSPWYAPFYGWLIFPVIMTLLTFIGSIIMIIFQNPNELKGIELAIYSSDVVNLIYLAITYIFWILRKKILPILMMTYFALMSIWYVIMYMYNIPINYLFLIMMVGWIFYFARSQRVKQTFVR